uniref:IVSP1-like protein n=1 Tax=Glypta fumiferanae TaxID=389681 RepID=A0A0F6QA71_9HYME|nr:IVSP1-like protein [Glypta fumiferanae]
MSSPETITRVDSNDIDANRKAHEAYVKMKGDRGKMFGGETSGVIYEYKLLSWLAACLFSFGSITNLFTTWHYIIDHSLLGAGSLLWMFQAAVRRDAPTFVQHALIFGMSIYVFVKHIHNGKYAYLTAALLCTSCAVYNHENLSPNSTSVCTPNVNELPKTTMNFSKQYLNDRDCPLGKITLTLDEKLNIIKRIKNLTDELKDIRNKELHKDDKSLSYKNITEQANSDMLYVPAKKHLDKLEKCLRRTIEHCQK